MIKARDSLDSDWCRHRKVSSLKAPNVTNALKGPGVLWTWAQLLGGRETPHSQVTLKWFRKIMSSLLSVPLSLH